MINFRSCIFKQDIRSVKKKNRISGKKRILEYKSIKLIGWDVGKRRSFNSVKLKKENIFYNYMVYFEKSFDFMLKLS